MRTREPGSIHFDDLGGDRLKGRSIVNGRLDTNHVERFWLKPLASQNLKIERLVPKARGDNVDRAAVPTLHLQDGCWPHIRLHAGVHWPGIYEAAVGQAHHFGGDIERLAMEVISFPSESDCDRCTDPCGKCRIDHFRIIHRHQDRVLDSRPKHRLEENRSIAWTSTTRVVADIGEDYRLTVRVHRALHGFVGSHRDDFEVRATSQMNCAKRRATLSACF